MVAPAAAGHSCNAGATDASRTPGGYSGIFGICFKIKRFWWYRLNSRHAALRIHITEFVAELIQIAMYSREWDEDYTELIDNMAVVQSIRQGKPRDLRLLELLLARHHVAEAMGARAHCTSSQKTPSWQIACPGASLGTSEWQWQRQISEGFKE